MKTRILTSVVLVALLLAVVLLGREVLGAAVFLLSIVAIGEFYGAFSKTAIKPVKTVGYIACLPVLGAAFSAELSSLGIVLRELVIPAVFIILLALFVLLVFKNDSFNLTDAAVTVFGILYIPFLFSFITLTRGLNYGEYLIWLIFIGAWVTDTCAYFTGSFLGKTKILPAVSPKKSLEGTIGGAVGCMAGVLIFGAVLGGYTGNIPIYHFAIIGLLCGIVSQLGDWAASAIKRYAGIKDYGSIMPGHGGILDRFDSILFTAPVIYFYMTIIIR